MLPPPLLLLLPPVAHHGNGQAQPSCPTLSLHEKMIDCKTKARSRHRASELARCGNLLSESGQHGPRQFQSLRTRGVLLVALPLGNGAYDQVGPAQSRVEVKTGREWVSGNRQGHGTTRVKSASNAARLMISPTRHGFHGDRLAALGEAADRGGRLLRDAKLGHHDGLQLQSTPC